MQALEAYPWPGNVRELRNAVERAMLLAEGDSPRPRALHDAGGDRRRSRSGFSLPRRRRQPRELERDLLVQALQRAHGNQTQAAQLLGMNRDQIRYRLEKFGLDKLGRPAELETRIGRRVEIFPGPGGHLPTVGAGRTGRMLRQPSIGRMRRTARPLLCHRRARLWPM